MKMRTGESKSARITRALVSEESVQFDGTRRVE